MGDAAVFSPRDQEDVVPTVRSCATLATNEVCAGWMIVFRKTGCSSLTTAPQRELCQEVRGQPVPPVQHIVQ
jgi:hypothetical protein